MIKTGGPVFPHDEMIWGADCGEGEWGNPESEGESKEWRPIGGRTEARLPKMVPRLSKNCSEAF